MLGAMQEQPPPTNMHAGVSRTPQCRTVRPHGSAVGHLRWSVPGCLAASSSSASLQTKLTRRISWAAASWARDLWKATGVPGWDEAVATTWWRCPGHVGRLAERDPDRWVSRPWHGATHCGRALCGTGTRRRRAAHRCAVDGGILSLERGGGMRRRRARRTGSEKCIGVA